VSPLEIEGNRWIPSMVLRTPDGELVVGAAADNLAGVHPDRLERTPKRALGATSPAAARRHADRRARRGRGRDARHRGRGSAAHR
jgi:molecular chaperone DnaK (HSP70)